MSVAAVVTDIEGTTSSIAFVHDVLFPYARARLAAFVRGNPQDAAPILAEVRAIEGGAALDTEGCIARLLEWQDADRKIAPLKRLQGMIWREGFARRAFTGHVYADAVEGLRRWHGRGLPLYVYSSGSVEAQKLIFGHSDFGDLLPLFSGYFDTAVGGKRDTASYAAIARAIGVPPGDILFLSDVAEELAAARAAGLQVVLLARDGAPSTSDYPVSTSFADILPAGETA